MNRQQGYLSRSQSKSSDLEVNGVLQRRAAVRTDAKQTVQIEEETKNDSWPESPLEKNFKPIPLGAKPSSGAALSQPEKEDKPSVVAESGYSGVFVNEPVHIYKSPIPQRSPFPPQPFEQQPTPALHGDKGLGHGAFTARIFQDRAVPPIQAKLIIGQPNDKYEQEADRVASQVVQQSNAPASTQSTQEQSVQLTEAPKEKEVQAKPDIDSLQSQEEGTEKQPLEAKKLAIPMLQREAESEAEEEEEEETVQTKAVLGQTPNLSANLEARIQSARGGGQPLPDSTRSFMEPRFGYDFSRVRVHTDSRAASASRDLNAQAFTVGKDIFFGSGRYAPESTGGRQLLAHELTHTIQQTSTPVLRTHDPAPSPSPFSQGNDSSSENEAESVSHPMVQKAPVAPGAISQGELGAQHLISLRRNAPQAPTVSEPSLSPLSSGGAGDKAAVGSKTQPESSTEANKEEIAPKEGVPAKLKDTKQAPSSPDKAPASEVAVESPEAPAIEAEEVAEVSSLSLEGSSDQGMVKFLESNPSQIAATQPSLGTQLDSKINQEQQDEVGNAPILVAKTSGTVQEGLKTPEQISVSGGAQISDGVTGADPGDLQASPTENLGTPPNNKDNERLLDRQEEDSFLSWLRNNRQSFLNSIRTTTGINTSAGKRPNVQLEGEADTERIANQRSDAESQLKAQRDRTTNAFKHHPGQQNIQPREVNEEKTAQLTPDAFVSIETPADTGAMDYVNAPLPPDVRNHADELLKPTLDANLANAKAQTQDAVKTRDRDKAAKINQAKLDTAAVNQKADKDQRDIVVANRQKVAQQQQEGIEESYAQVNEFIAEADKKQTADRKEIGDKVKESEGDARKELEKGEEDAEKEKEAKEKKAGDKKKELEKAQENDSWWDRAASAIKSAVKKITSAIDDIFTALRDAVKTIIEEAKNAAISLINKARNWIVDKLNKFRDWAKNQVNKYLKDSFPNFAKRINAGIDSVVDTAITGVNVVADQAIAGVEAVANGLAGALDKVLQVFQTALKATVQIVGAVITGDFAEALRIAVQAACDIAGIDSQPIFDFINRAASKIVAILKDPKTFFNNVMEAIGGGVSNFSKNIKQHLIKGLIGWLTGALSEVNLSLPETFDAKGILSLVMQILGLTYENIKAKVIKKFPPAAKVIGAVEKGIEIVQRLANDDPTALWEEVKQKVSNLKEIVISGIRDFVIKTIVKEGIAWLLSLLNPAAAIVKLLKLVFDFVMFLVERFQQIKDFVMSVYNSIAAIAAGNLSQAKKAVEDALSRSLPVVISLLASLAGLGGIGKTVKNIIGKVAKPVNKIVDNLVARMVKFAKNLLKEGRAVGKKVKDKLLWWKKKKQFKNRSGEAHTLFFKGKGKKAKLFMQSAEVSLLDEISKLKKSKVEEERKLGKKLEAEVNSLNDDIAANANKKSQEKEFPNRIALQLNTISKSLSKLSGKDIPPTSVTYRKQGDKAGSVTAWPLTSIAGNTKGSPPTTESIPGWELVETFDFEKVDIKNKTGKVIGQREVPLYWRKFHLLNNEKMHGPGEKWNLVPAHQKDNSRYLNGIEEPMSKKINDSDILYFKVSVSEYHSEAPKGSRSEDLDAKDKAKYDALYTNYPKRLTVDAGYLEKTNNGFKKDKGRNKIFDSQDFDFKSNMDVTVDPKIRIIILSSVGQPTIIKHGVSENNAQFLAKHGSSISSVNGLVDKYFMQENDTGLSTIKTYLDELARALEKEYDNRSVLLFENSQNSAVISQIEEKIKKLNNIEANYPASKVGEKFNEIKSQKPGLTKAFVWSIIEKNAPDQIRISINGIIFMIPKKGRRSYEQALGGKGTLGPLHHYYLLQVLGTI